MAGPASNYNDEILNAMREHDAYALFSPHPFAAGFEQTPGNEADPLARALQAAIAIKSAQENETIPEGDVRQTNQLDRANYPGS